MGVKGGPNIPNWDTFDTMLDPSSIFSYPGTGFTFTNPLRQNAGASDWTMDAGLNNLVAGTGISKYVQQLSRQAFSQRIEQSMGKQSTIYSHYMIYKVSYNLDYSNAIQWNSFQGTNIGNNANGTMYFQYNGTTYNASGMAVTDGVWRHYAFILSGTACTMYINGEYSFTFSGWGTVTTGANNTKMFDFPGSSGSIGLLWFKLGQADSATIVKRHFEAVKGRFGIT